jgi:hypothetical protein
MVTQPRRPIAIAGAGLLLAAAVLLWTRGAATSGVPAPAAPLQTAAVEEPARIDLGRLSESRGGTPAGKRDILRYDKRPVPGTATPPPPPPPTVAVAPPPTMLAPPPPSTPPLNVHYIGSVENKLGLRVAVLMTDRKEILTGQAGEVVANRFKIIKIGFESVDVQDLGSDRVRRIPFKGN